MQLCYRCKPVYARARALPSAGFNARATSAAPTGSRTWHCLARSLKYLASHDATPTESSCWRAPRRSTNLDQHVAFHGASVGDRVGADDGASDIGADDGTRVVDADDGDRVGDRDDGFGDGDDDGAGDGAGDGRGDGFEDGDGDGAPSSSSSRATSPSSSSSSRATSSS